MHYHEAAIVEQKNKQITTYKADFYHKLYKIAEKRYAHIYDHVIKPCHSYGLYEIRSMMWNYEMLMNKHQNWRWRYYFVIKEINKLLS